MEEQTTEAVIRLRERLTAVERDSHHLERWLRDELGTVKLRLIDLERDNRLPSVSAGTKLLLAMLIPLAVYLLTGSIEKAASTASFIGAGG